jgi:hypothetical protein
MQALHALMVLVQATALEPAGCWHVGVETAQGRVHWSGPAHSAQEAEQRARRVTSSATTLGVFDIRLNEHKEDCGGE